MSLKKIIFSITILMSLASTLIARAQEHYQHWQVAKSVSGNYKAIYSHPDIEIFSAPNTIMVKVNHDVDLRIFTILGKLISEEKLEPGIFQCQVDSHGIYIIKTGESSCKIAI